MPAKTNSGGGSCRKCVCFSCAAFSLLIALSLIGVGALLPTIYDKFVENTINNANIINEDGSWSEQDLIDKFTSTLSYDMFLFNITNLRDVMDGGFQKMNLQEVYVPINRVEHAFDFTFQEAGGHRTIKYSKWVEDSFRNPEDADKTIVQPNYGYTFAIEALGGSEAKASVGLSYKFTETLDGYFSMQNDTTYVALRTYCYAAYVTESWKQAVKFYTLIPPASGNATMGAELALDAWLDKNPVSKDGTGGATCGAYPTNTGCIKDQITAAFSGGDPTDCAVGSGSPLCAQPYTMTAAAPFMDNWEAVAALDPATGTPVGYADKNDAQLWFGLKDCTGTPGVDYACMKSPLYNPQMVVTFAYAGQEFQATGGPGENFNTLLADGYSLGGVLAIGFHMAITAGLTDLTAMGIPFYTPLPQLLEFNLWRMADNAENGFPTGAETPTWDLENDFTDIPDLFHYQMATGEFIKYTSPGITLLNLGTGGAAFPWGATFPSLKFLPRPISLNDVRSVPEGTTDVPGLTNTYSVQTKWDKAQFDSWLYTIMGNETHVAGHDGDNTAAFAQGFALAGAYAADLGARVAAFGAWQASSGTQGDNVPMGTWLAMKDPYVIDFHNTRHGTSYTTNNEWWTYWTTQNPAILPIAGANPAAAYGLAVLQYAMDGMRAKIDKDYGLDLDSVCLKTITDTEYDDGNAIIGGTWSPELDFVEAYRCFNYLQYLGIWQVLFFGALQGGSEPPVNMWDPTQQSDVGIFPGNVGLFAQQTIQQVLFGWDDPLLEAFGFGDLNPTPGFNGPRDTSEDTYREKDRSWNREIYTGVPEKSLTGVWYKFNQIETYCNFSDAWTNATHQSTCEDPFGQELDDCRVWLECEQLSGNRFSQYSWFQEDGDRPDALNTLYVAQAARSVQMDYTETRDYKGVSLWYYDFNEDNMIYSADKAKYRMTENDVDGLIDIQHLRKGVPLALSQPYLGQAPAEVVNRYTYELAEGHTGGAVFDAAKHNSRIGIDKFTGRMLYAQRQLGASTMIKRCVLDSGIWDNIFPDDIVCNASNPNKADDRLYHQLYWVNEEGGITDADADTYVFRLHTMGDMAGYLQIIFPIVGFLKLIFCVWWLLRLINGGCGLTPEESTGSSLMGTDRPINENTSHPDDDNL